MSYRSRSPTSDEPEDRDRQNWLLGFPLGSGSILPRKQNYYVATFYYPRKKCIESIIVEEFLIIFSWPAWKPVQILKREMIFNAIAISHDNWHRHGMSYLIWHILIIHNTLSHYLRASFPIAGLKVKCRFTLPMFMDEPCKLTIISERNWRVSINSHS
jgi:hypothetical protein